MRHSFAKLISLDGTMVTAQCNCGAVMIMSEEFYNTEKLIVCETCFESKLHILYKAQSIFGNKFDINNMTVHDAKYIGVYGVLMKIECRECKSLFNRHISNLDNPKFYNGDTTSTELTTCNICLNKLRGITFRSNPRVEPRKVREKHVPYGTPKPNPTLPQEVVEPSSMAETLKRNSEIFKSLPSWKLHDRLSSVKSHAARRKIKTVLTKIDNKIYIGKMLPRRLINVGTTASNTFIRVRCTECDTYRKVPVEFLSIRDAKACPICVENEKAKQAEIRKQTTARNHVIWVERRRIKFEERRRKEAEQELIYQQEIKDLSEEANQAKEKLHKIRQLRDKELSDKLAIQQKEITRTSKIMIDEHQNRKAKRLEKERIRLRQAALKLEISLRKEQANLQHQIEELEVFVTQQQSTLRFKISASAARISKSTKQIQNIDIEPFNVATDRLGLDGIEYLQLLKDIYSDVKPKNNKTKHQQDVDNIKIHLDAKRAFGSLLPRYIRNGKTATQTRIRFRCTICNTYTWITLATLNRRSLTCCIKCNKASDLGATDTAYVKIDDDGRFQSKYEWIKSRPHLKYIRRLGHNDLLNMRPNLRVECKCGKQEQINIFKLRYDEYVACRACETQEKEHNTALNVASNYIGKQFQTLKVLQFIGEWYKEKHRIYPIFKCECTYCGTIAYKDSRIIKHSRCHECCGGVDTFEKSVTIGVTYNNMTAIGFGANNNRDYPKCRCIKCGYTQVVYRTYLTSLAHVACKGCSQHVSYKLDRDFNDLMIPKYWFDANPSTDLQYIKTH